MRNFFWEGHKGGKVNHLGKWEFVTQTQADGGLCIGGLRTKNIALLAKWGGDLSMKKTLYGAK